MSAVGADLVRHRIRWWNAIAWLMRRAGALSTEITGAESPRDVPRTRRHSAAGIARVVPCHPGPVSAITNRWSRLVIYTLSLALQPIAWVLWKRHDPVDYDC